MDKPQDNQAPQEDSNNNEPLPGIFSLTPMNPDFNDNPHVILDRLRTECPVHRDTTAGTFLLTRYEDVRGVVGDRSMWRSPIHAEEAAVIQRALVNQKIEGIVDELDGGGSGILLLDDPDHGRIRGPLQKALYKRVAVCKPLVQRVVDETLDAIGDKKSFDVMAEFALKVPIDAIARILGVDNARLTEFREWSEGVILVLNPFRSEEETKRFVVCGNALSAYMAALMNEKRKQPQDDLVTDMVKLKDEGADLTDGEISTNLQGLLIGGNLTTTDLIGNAIWLLLTHPEELAKLKADPSLINSCVEEVLRYEAPVDITSRIAPREMNVGGCPVHQSQSMFLSLRGANRDPSVFTEPHKFDISRREAPHVAFGGGAHLCIGAPLARMEAQSAILSFFQRYPNARLADPNWKPEWRTLPFFRGLKELPVLV
jgi:hypothetical protein